MGQGTASRAGTRRLGGFASVAAMTLALPACDGLWGSRTLSGTCSDADGIRGDVVSGATVIVGDLFGAGFDEDADIRPEPGDFDGLAEVETDDQGTFTIEGLPAERVDVFVVHPDYFEFSSSTSLKSESRSVECALQAFVFDVRIRGWETADFIPTSAGSDFGFQADPGLTWLVVDVELQSHARDERFIDGFSGGFTYITNDQLIFDSRLQLNAPEGALPGQVAPLGTVAGAIYFEVPVGHDPTGGVLVPGLEDGPARISIPFLATETAR
jgi:hypothetical protein